MSFLENDKKWALESYAVWEQNTWKNMEIDKQNSYIILSSSLVLIVSKEVALESLNLLGGCGRIESFFANATIAIHVTDKNKTSKFRVRLAEGFRYKSHIENCLEVIEELQKFIIVTKHPSHSGKTPEKSEDKKYSELAKQFLEEGRFNFKDAVESVMKKDISKKSVQKFLLDPQSHAMVNKVLQYFPRAGPKSNEHC